MITKKNGDLDGCYVFESIAVKDVVVFSSSPHARRSLESLVTIENRVSCSSGTWCRCSVSMLFFYMTACLILTTRT